jgi:hypothetical protein
MYFIGYWSRAKPQGLTRAETIEAIQYLVAIETEPDWHWRLRRGTRIIPVSM